MRRLSLRETRDVYKRFMVHCCEDPRLKLCGIVVSSSWHDPVACAFRHRHEGPHSWASIPALYHTAAAEALGESCRLDPASHHRETLDGGES